MKKNYLTKTKVILTILVPVILLAIGTFYDLQIDTVLYNPDSFISKVFAAFGMFPFSMLLCFTGLSFFRMMHKYNKYLMIILFVVCELFAVYIIHHETKEYYVNLGIFVYLIDLFVVLILNIIMFPIVGGASTSKLMRYCMFLLLFACIALGAVEALKIICARPRYMLLVENNQIQFKNWYTILGNSAIKKEWIAKGVDKDMFRSFPSGHTLSGSTLLFISSLGYVNKKFSSKKMANIMYAIALIYIAILAFTRLVLGCHFLSDVAMSFLITFISYCILNKLFGIGKDTKKVKA